MFPKTPNGTNTGKHDPSKTCPEIQFRRIIVYKQFSAINYSILLILQYGTMNYLHWSDGVFFAIWPIIEIL